MKSGRKYKNHSIDARDPRLRMSSNFLASQLIRNSLTPTFCCSIRFRSSNIDKITENDRFFSPVKHLQSSITESEEQIESYTHLKDTLSELQLKIKNAQQIFKKSSKTKLHYPQPFFDYQQTISEIQSNATKKIDYTYNSATDVSSRNLSFVKNTETVLEISPGRRNKKNKNQYYVGNLFEGKKDRRVDEHLLLSMKTFKNVHKFSALTASEFQEKWSWPQAPQFKNKKTVLLDIDQTILHCDEHPVAGQIYDLELEVPIGQNQHVTAYISLRPYALTFLKNISKVFQVIAYTASQQSYADVVLNQLDPEREIFSHRIYRSSCQLLTSSQIYAKDIRILNRKPQNVILIDNSPYSYIFQLQNGIPILPYISGTDKQLPKLEKYLLQLNKCSDVREMNKAVFGFHRYNEFPDLKELIHQLYLNCS